MANSQSANHMPGGILVVEDTPESLKLLCDLLVDAGHSVRQAQDGTLALMTVRAKLPELILLDITMPGIDGYEVCRRLKADPTTRDVPVIFLSAMQEPENRIMGFRLGAVDFIAKPYQAEEVLLRVQTHLELRRLRLQSDALVAQRTIALKNEISMRHEVEEGLRLASEALEASFNGIMITDAGGHIVRVNPAFTRITGYAASEVLGKKPDILKSGRHDEAFYREMWRSLNETGNWMGEILNRRKDGNVSTMHETISAFRHSSGAISNYISVIVDVSEIQDAQTLIDFLAYHDGLTGVPNRLVARRHFDVALASTDVANQEYLGVLCLDLDRFKVINDSLGHSLGDQILKILAGKLSALIQEPKMLSRQGGDEFLVVAPKVASLRDLSALADSIIHTIAEELIADERKLTVTASMGVAVYPHDGQTLDELIRCAENALYQAKIRGGNTYCFFTQEMDAEARAKMEMEILLRDAAGNGELQVVYQPKISSIDGHIVGAEALIRWNNPVLGNVSPVRFIPLAEETGLINQIGEWVLHQVCGQIRSWQDQGLGRIKIAVNLSGHQFRRHDINLLVETMLHRYDVPAAALDLEITESILMEDTDKAIKVLQQLKQIGVTISLDDFGTGYSSLAYLKHFPIDSLKIDKSFVDSVHHNSGDAAIACTIISLAKNLKMNVIAEGVETEPQFKFLQAQGCDQIQGYYFSKPVTATAFEGLLRNGPMDVGVCGKIVVEGLPVS